MNAALCQVSRTLARVTALCGAIVFPACVTAGPITYDLTFQTTGQSMWANGTSTRLNQTSFLGASWNNATNRAGDIVGNNDTNLPNPERLAYDAAFGACRALGNSSSACINGQTARAPVPRLGSRPSVRSCGRFNFRCQAGRAGDLARRASYDVAFSACRSAGFSSSVCRNGQSARLPVAALGTAPPSFLTVDTRTGVEVVATSDGRVGLDLGMQIDSGSVDATVSYQAKFELPEDTTQLDRSQSISFNPESILAGVNTLETTFPSLALSVDAVMELSGSVGAEACLIGAGCTSGRSPFLVEERAPVVSFNQDGEGGVLLFGESPSDFGFPPKADGFPFTLDVANLAEVRLHLPQPNASGGLDTATGSLRASGQDDLIDLILDLDNIVATSAGLPGLFGSSASFGPVDLGFDIINVAMGPTIDLVQNFELEPTLHTTLLFDQAVMVAGELVNAITSPWDFLPDITFLADRTAVTPTFFLESVLSNNLLLDFDLQFFIDLLQVNFDAGVLGKGSFGIGNILDQAADLFASPAFFSSLFPLGGFDLQVGESFFVDFTGDTLLSGTLLATSAINPTLNLPDTLPGTVPTPATWATLLAGLLALIVMRRRTLQAPCTGRTSILVA